MKKITINKNLKFSFDDLTQYVNINKPFTLRDVCNCVKNSKVPIQFLKKTLKCRHLEEYINEIDKKKSSKKDTEVIDYLEVYCGSGEFGAEDNKHLRWSFHGIGKKDKFGVEKYALDFTPLCEIADLNIKISDTMIVYDKDSNKITNKKIDTLLMLVEFLYAIFWEVSWNGSIENREARLQELKRRVGNIKKNIKSKK